MTLAALRRTLRHRPWAWLLALAFWLPAAQCAAAAHALLHLQSAAETDRCDLSGDLPGPCDLCVVAASMGGTAPPPQAPAALPPLPPVGHVHARAGTAPRAFAAPADYDSRAPPLPNA